MSTGSESFARVSASAPKLMFFALMFSGYQFLLCLLNTNLFSVNNAVVTATEVILLGLLLLWIFPALKDHEIALAGGLLLYFVALAFFRGMVELSGPRNIAIILLAYIAGKRFGNREIANRVIWTLSLIVLGVGLIEFFFTDLYFRFCNVLAYYISRGGVAESASEWVTQDSFVSGVRMAGRNLFPFLGDLRVSSIFLEPVSMGNFAVILWAWALSFDAGEWRKSLPHFLLSAIFIIAADSRFASMLVGILIIARMLPFMRWRRLLFIMPMLTVAGLIIFTLLEVGSAREDNLTGRLARSGWSTLDMSFANLIGYAAPEILPDEGIAYSLEYFGLFLASLLWAMFSLSKFETHAAERLRVLLAIYALSILLISGTSLYSSKTAFIAWFIFGCSGAATALQVRTEFSHYNRRNGGYRDRPLLAEYRF